MLKWVVICRTLKWVVIDKDLDNGLKLPGQIVGTKQPSKYNKHVPKR